MVREIDIRPYSGKPICGRLYLPGNQRMDITANPTSVLTVNGLEALYFSFISSDKQVFQWTTTFKLAELRQPFVAYCKEYLHARGSTLASSKVNVFISDRAKGEAEHWQILFDLEQRSRVDSYFPGSSIIMVDGQHNLRALILNYYREQQIETHIRVPAEEKDIDALTTVVFQTSDLRFRSEELNSLQDGIRTIIEEAKKITNVHRLR